MKKCINCSWEGEEVTDKGFCPVCGDNVKSSEDKKEEVKPKSKKKVSGDLNGDGKFDKKDLSLAAKVMAKGRKKR